MQPKSPQSNQLLRTSRMNSNTIIKILLGSPHLHSNAETLRHLPNTQPQNMQTNNLLLGPGTHNLHLCGVLGFLVRGQHVVVHGGELGVVDLDLVVAEAGAGFGFCEADGADFGVREDDRGDVVVGEFGGFELGGAEEAVAELAAGGDGDCLFMLVLVFSGMDLWEEREWDVPGVNSA